MERIKLVFLLADKRQRFLQIDIIILGVTRHAQITQNNKFAISLQYLEKKVSDEVDLLHDGDGQTFPNFAMSLQYLKKS